MVNFNNNINNNFNGNKNNSNSNFFENLNKNYEQYNSNYEKLFNQILNCNLEQIAKNTYSLLLTKNKLKVNFFNEFVIVDTLKKQVINYNNNQCLNTSKIDLFASTIVLHYLINADDTPLSGDWISYRDLPDGLFYSSTIPDVLYPLTKMYEKNGQGFINKLLSLGGIIEKNFKYGAIIFPFKKFPILFILEEKDEEFEACVRVLFDRNSNHYMKSDIIKTLLVYTFKKIVT